MLRGGVSRICGRHHDFLFPGCDAGSRSSIKRVVRAPSGIDVASFTQEKETYWLSDGNLSLLGALIDFTPEVRAWDLAPYTTVPSTDSPQNGEHPPISRTSVPELCRVKYVESTRSRDRYLMQVLVSLEIQGEYFVAVSHDVSRTALRIDNRMSRRGKNESV